jgi:hypothetical protein
MVFCPLFSACRSTRERKRPGMPGRFVITATTAQGADWLPGCETKRGGVASLANCQVLR